MIVRARIKQLEQIEPRILCCNLTIEWVKHKNKINEIFTVDTSKTKIIPCFCLNCGTTQPSEYIWIVNCSEIPNKGWGMLALYDLDEGLSE